MGRRLMRRRRRKGGEDGILLDSGVRAAQSIDTSLIETP